MEGFDHSFANGMLLLPAGARGHGGLGDLLNNTGSDILHEFETGGRTAGGTRYSTACW